MSLFVRLCQGVNDKGILIPEEEVYDYVDASKDFYQSIYYYNENHYKRFQEVGTIRGITDVQTNKLVFDFDARGDVGKAYQDVNKLCGYLTTFLSEKDLEIYYSGNKGFNVVLTLDKFYTPKQIRAAAFNLANQYTTFDTSLYDASQILRVPGTRHPESGLYKIPLTYKELYTLSVEEIKKKAFSLDNIDNNVFEWGIVKLDPKFFEFKEEPIEFKSKGFSLDNKPKFLTNCRWALQNGLFKEGERNSAFLCLCATYKNLGFELDHTYRLLKGVAELQARKNNIDRYPDEEIYNNIVTQVYSDFWKNGQFTCKEKGSWLHTYCTSLLEYSCAHDKSNTNPRTLVDVTGGFKTHVKNIDKNTISLGLPSLDKKLFISTGCNMGIVGAAASGKSSVALNILNHTSKQNVKSVFASLDMHSNRMFEKVMYKLSGGMRREDLYWMFQNDKEGPLIEKLKQEFGNCFFFNKSSPTVEDVRNYVLDCQEQSGDKIKLVMLDYFERVSSDFSDDTQASKRVAGELQDLVNDLDIALITLFQPNKAALGGGMDSPIYDYTKIKGSSFVFQSLRIILSIWRPFSNPKDHSNDKFLQAAILKNDLGELSEFVYNWNGKKGEITEMEQHQYSEFEELLKIKEAQKLKDNGGWS